MISLLLKDFFRFPSFANLRLGTLDTITFLNEEVRLFFPGDTSIWSFPSVSSLSDLRHCPDS